MTRSIDFAALLIVVAWAGITCAQITDGSITGVLVITACTCFTGSPCVTGRTSTGFNLGCSSIPSEILHGGVHADITDICRGHMLAVRRANQNSLQIGQHDHKVRSGSAARSFGGQSFPFSLFQWNGICL